MRALPWLLIGAMCCSAPGAPVETAIQPLREIQLPVPASRGSYSHFPYSESARDHFAMRVAPDQSILIFDSDASGKWLLVREKNWWTDKPASEVLEIPGWSAADSEHLDGMRVDVQVTPNGRYAVAFAEAIWMAKSSFLLHVPKGYVEREPDTIITVIDLERWEVANSIHTAGARDARVLNENWIGLDAGIPGAPSDPEHGVYRSHDRSLSIPTLRPGPECVAQRFSHVWSSPPVPLAESVRTQNDLACRELYEAAGADSTEAMEMLIERASGVEPPDIKLHMLDFIQWNVQTDAGRLWMAESLEQEYFRHWGEYPYYDIYMENPPFESSSHLWYGLYDAHEGGMYELDRYDAQGKGQMVKTEPHLLCGDASLGHLKSACGCKVVDVSEERDTLLTYCRQQHGDFDGMVQRQWLSVFRSDDLSPVGLIDLAKNSESLLAIASGDGRAYVVTLDYGEKLRVFAIPDKNGAPGDSLRD